MSLKWEGHIWMDDLDGFTAVKMQHNLCTRFIASETSRLAPRS